MTPEELKAIRERAEKATPGPWEADKDLPAVLAHSRRWDERLSMLTVNPIFGDDGKQWRHDQQFIAHAREDIPRLLDEIDRLLKEMMVGYDMLKVLFEALQHECAGDHKSKMDAAAERLGFEKIETVTEHEDGGSDTHTVYRSQPRLSRDCDSGWSYSVGSWRCATDARNSPLIPPESP